MKTQKFPKDTGDGIEQMFADRVLAEFPSYGKFWEKFIGVDVTRLSEGFWPRSPKFPKEYEDAKREDFRNKQIGIARVSYGIFCNLAGAHYQLELYLKQIPITDRESFFRAIEAVECAYLHIGNVAYGLDRLWGEIRKYSYHKEKLEKYLVNQGRGKYLLELKDEPKKIIRDEIVHFGRHVFRITDKIYLPLTVPRNKLWSKANVSSWIPADVKLKDHITVASKACEDAYQLFIERLSTYLQNEGIEIP
jgi:hypothetical protein